MKTNMLQVALNYSEIYPRVSVCVVMSVVAPPPPNHDTHILYWHTHTYTQAPSFLNAVYDASQDIDVAAC